MAKRQKKSDVPAPLAIPVTLMVSAEHAAALGLVREGRRTARSRRSFAGTPQAPAVAADAPARGRGRAAGHYVVGGKKPVAATLTDSIKGVYNLIKTHKRGMTAKDIASRLDMPMGTVGWGLQILRKTGAIQYEAAPQTA